MEDFHNSGGVGALLKEIAPLLHTDSITATGQTLGQNFEHAINYDQDVIRTLDNPMNPEGGLAVSPARLRRPGR